MIIIAYQWSLNSKSKIRSRLIPVLAAVLAVGICCGGCSRSDRPRIGLIWGRGTDGLELSFLLASMNILRSGCSRNIGELFSFTFGMIQGSKGLKYPRRLVDSALSMPIVQSVVFPTVYDLLTASTAKTPKMLIKFHYNPSQFPHISPSD